MKKTCNKCWFGGRGGKNKYKVSCQKLGCLVDANKQRNACKHYTTQPRERRFLPMHHVGEYMNGWW